MKKIKSILAGIFIFLLIFPIHSFSQTEEDLLEMSLEDLLNISVVAVSKKAENINDAPGIITVISNQEIKGFAANNLGEVLNRVVGTAFLGANVWADNVIQIRGQSITPYNNHVLILLNGRPLRDPISGGLNAPVLTGFPLDVIDHIEIIRGPGSVLYGSCAFSGVINIVTKTLQTDNTESFAKVGAGTWGTWYASASTMTKKDDFSFNLGISHFSTYGPEFTFYDAAGTLNTANFDKKNYGVHLNSSIGRLNINGYLGKYDKYSLDGADLIWATNPHSETNHLNYQADITYLLLDRDKIDINTSFTYNRHELDLAVNNDAIGQDYLFEITANYTPFEKTNIVFGGIYETEDYFGSYLIDNTLTNFSLYAQMDYTIFKMFKLVGGLQYNKIENIDGNISPRIGMVANVTKNLGAKILYSQAFRKGYPLETSFDIPVFRGNLELDPELINTFEAQVFFQSEKIQTSFTYYNSKIKQMIIRKWFDDASIVPFGGYLLYGNIDGSATWGSGTFDFWGYEFESKFSITSKLFFTLNALYQENESADGIFNATLHPNFYAKTGLMYNGEKFQASIFNGYFGEPRSVSKLNPSVLDINETPEAYNLLSIKVSTDLMKLFSIETKKEVNVGFSGYNLLNEDVRYPEYTSKGINSLTPLMGGTAFYLDLSLRF